MLFCALYINIAKGESLRSRLAMCYFSSKTSQVLYSTPQYKAIYSTVYSMEHCIIIMYNYDYQNPAQAGVQPLTPVYESTAEPKEPPRKAQCTGSMILGQALLGSWVAYINCVSRSDDNNLILD